MASVDEAALKAAGAHGVLKAGNVIQVVVGAGGRHDRQRHRRPEPMADELQLLAPLPGRVLPLSEVPDPVFAGAMVGPGAAVDPPRGPVQAVAPVGAGSPSCTRMPSSS